MMLYTLLRLSMHIIKVAVHPNMRGHSGGGLSLGRGFPIVGSTKQKLKPEVPRRLRSSVSMPSCQLYAGRAIS